MKRTERVGYMIKTLTDAPGKLFPLQHFCDIFDVAKSSISEDINLADASIRSTGTGYVETISGAKGGVRFMTSITPEALKALQDEFCERLKDSTRILGGGFLYTSDLMRKVQPRNVHTFL